MAPSMNDVINTMGVVCYGCHNNLTKSMEADYLKRCVGRCLSEGLAEVAAKRPGDPVEYLALWLLKHKENSINRQKQCAHDEQQLSPPATEDTPGNDTPVTPTTEEGTPVVSVVLVVSEEVEETPPVNSEEPELAKPLVVEEEPKPQDGGDDEISERPSATKLGRIEEEKEEELATESEPVGQPSVEVEVQPVNEEQT